MRDQESSNVDSVRNDTAGVTDAYAESAQVLDTIARPPATNVWTPELSPGGVATAIRWLRERTRATPMAHFAAWALAVGDFATFKDLFLPDGHSFFDLLNSEAASRKGILSMGGRYRNHNTCLTYLHRPNTVNDGQPATFPLLLCLLSQLCHLLLCHF